MKSSWNVIKNANKNDMYSYEDAYIHAYEVDWQSVAEVIPDITAAVINRVRMFSYNSHVQLKNKWIHKYWV